MSYFLVSIIIPTYQQGKTIFETLKSIFNQTCQNFEIIIVNDGSTDGTEKILDHYLAELPKEEREKVKVIHQENRGANAARNRGAQEAKGDFLLFCDADVVMKKEMLEKMVNELKKRPLFSYIYSDFKYHWKTFRLFKFDPGKLKEMPYINTMSLIRAEHFPGFDEKIKKFQDWDLWLTMLEKGYQGYHLSEILFKIKPHHGGISQWMPRFLYKVPWYIFPFKFFMPKAIKKYQKAMEIIKEKHNL